MSKSSTSDGKVNSDSEDHQPKFRGVYCPAEIFDLLEQDKITSTEFILLMRIDSLVDAKGQGCWASNAWLAKKTNVSETHVRFMLQKLIGMGLITRYVNERSKGDEKRRILETAWSRVRPEHRTPQMDRHLNGCTPQIYTQDMGRHQDNTQNTSYSSCNSSERLHRRRPARPAASQADDSDEPSLMKTGKSASPSPEGWALACAKKLYESLESVHKVRRQPKLDKWKKEFTILAKEITSDHMSLEEAKEEIMTILAWYCANHQRQYVPQALSGSSFRSKYDEIIAAKSREEDRDEEGETIVLDGGTKFHPDDYQPYRRDNNVGPSGRRSK